MMDAFVDADDKAAMKGVPVEEFVALDPDTFDNLEGFRGVLVFRGKHDSLRDAILSRHVHVNLAIGRRVRNGNNVAAAAANKLADNLAGVKIDSETAVRAKQRERQRAI